jgi:hypothetical protein
MKGTVNPFEPWRPLADRIPQPLHIGRPWRPPPPPPVRAAVEEPPFVEPVNPVPRNKPPERPKPPQARASTSAPRRTPISQLAGFIILGFLGILSFDIMGWLGGTHAPRLIGLGASVGLFASMAFSNRRDWSTRLTWMAAALALAGITLWFVPTMRGNNLYSAYRQVEKLRALPAGAIAEYKRDAAARRTLMEEFPSFTPDLKQAEKAWLRRTVDEAIENSDRQLDKDPDAVLVRLHQVDKEVSQLEYYGLVRKDLESARRRAVQACLKGAQP